MEFSFSCPICIEEFDPKEHFPINLICCGKSLCKDCLNQILQKPIQINCPLCGTLMPKEANTIASFPLNRTLLEVIEQMKNKEVLVIQDDALKDPEVERERRGNILQEKPEERKDFEEDNGRVVEPDNTGIKVENTVASTNYREIGLFLVEKDAKSLKITPLLDDEENIEDGSLQEIKQVLSAKDSNLRELCLNLDNCSNITSEGLEVLAVSMWENLKYIKVLELSFGGWNGLDDNGITLIFKVLEATKPKLEAFKLNVKGSSISDKSLHNLCVSLATSQQSLKELKLNFQDCTKLTNVSLDKLGKFLFFVNPDVREIALNFHGCKEIENSAFEVLLGGIFINDLNLKGLDLNFGQNKDNDLLILGAPKKKKKYKYKPPFDPIKGFECAEKSELIIGLIRAGSNLERLALNFRNCADMRSRGPVEVINSILLAEPRLVYLKLDFRLGRSAALPGALAYINKLLKAVKETIRNFQFFTDMGVPPSRVESLVTLLKWKPERFEYVKIVFERCQELDDENVKCLNDVMFVIRRTGAYAEASYPDCRGVTNKNILPEE